MSYFRDGKEYFMDGGVEEELVKIASDAHPQGYFTGLRSQMTEDQVEYVDGPQPGDKVTVGGVSDEALTKAQIIDIIESINEVSPAGAMAIPKNANKAELLSILAQAREGNEARTGGG